MKTLLLDIEAWDLVLDAGGNLAVATDPYSVVQNVASACRTFEGECWYDTTLGIPYFTDVLGQQPTLSLVKTLIVNAAVTVPGCFNPVCYLSAFDGRRLSGQVQFTDSNGEQQAAGF